MRELFPPHTLSLPKRTPRRGPIPGEIHLDSNEQPYQPSPKVLDAVKHAMMFANRYPETSSIELRDRLAGYTNVPADQIVVGNGSDEVIEWLARALLANGDEVIVPKPSFFYYATTTRAVGGVVTYVERNPDFSLNADAILAAVTPRTKILYVANPNNPTGEAVPRETIVKFLDALDCLVVVDECYFEFHGETVLDLLPKYPHLFVMRSFSKAFGLAGLRVGYGIGTLQICDYLTRCAQSYSVNRLAQAAAIAALDDIRYATAHIAMVKVERERMREELTRLGFHVYPSATNFLLVNSRGAGKTSTAIADALRERGVFVADFAGFPGLDEYSLRITIGTRDENQLLLKRLTALQ